MHLQPRDIELFKCLNKFRFLALPHAQKLVFVGVNDPSVIRRRLRKLQNAGFLGAVALHDKKGVPTGKVYFLKEPAYEHLDGDFTRRSLPKEFFLAHTVDLVTVQIKIEDWFAGHDRFALAGFRTESHMKTVDGKQVRAIHDKITVEGNEIRIRPDAAFVLQHRTKETKILHFIENDRGTESRRQLEPKFDSYRDYAQHPERFKKKYGVTFDRFAVLFITTSERRIERIQKWFGGHGGFSRFLFTTMDKLKAAPGPTAPIWTREPKENIGLIKAP